MKILVVTNNIEDQAIIKQTLATESSLEFVEATTIEVGKNIFNEYPIELVICDLSDSNNPNFEMLDTVKSIQPNIDVIVFTDSKDLKVVSDCLNKGVFAIIHKPLIQDEIRVIIRNAIKKRMLWISNEEYKYGLKKKLDEKTKELEENNRDLEAKVQAQAEQLVNADRVALLRNLMNGIAHDLNNPNAYIRSTIKNISKIHECLQPYLEEYFKNREDIKFGTVPMYQLISKLPRMTEGVLEATERILMTIDDLTSYCSLDSEVSLDEKIPISVFEVIEKALNMAKFILRETADVTFNCDKSIEIFGSELSMRQLFLNLIVNACHAIQDKGPERGEIKINVAKYGPGQKYMTGYVQIDISDNGCGIPEKLKQKIFSPYFTTKEQGRGSGLGLAINMGIIARYNGELKIESEVGEGTTFSVLLPSK